MSAPTYIVGSVEYLKVKFTADVPIEDSEIPEIKLNGSWLAAEWVGAESTVRIAQTLVDFSDIPVGFHQIYGRITDYPEVPVLVAGKISVVAETE